MAEIPPPLQQGRPVSCSWLATNTPWRCRKMWHGECRSGRGDQWYCKWILPMQIGFANRIPILGWSLLPRMCSARPLTIPGLKVPWDFQFPQWFSLFTHIVDDCEILLQLVDGKHSFIFLYLQCFIVTNRYQFVQDFCPSTLTVYGNHPKNKHTMRGTVYTIHSRWFWGWLDLYHMNYAEYPCPNHACFGGPKSPKKTPNEWLGPVDFERNPSNSPWLYTFYLAYVWDTWVIYGYMGVMVSETAVLNIV